MKLNLNNIDFIDTNKPIDISISLTNSESNLSAWSLEKPIFEPVNSKEFKGLVSEGGKVNFRNIFFNPHAHVTHTECLGHITENIYSINKTLNTFFFKAKLITINPISRQNIDGLTDFIITPDLIPHDSLNAEALIVRTLPNNISKKSMNYSSKNPVYFDVLCADKIIQSSVKHLLVDLPSVDRESDNGRLAFHHAFWEVPKNPNFERTITEMIFVDDSILDGDYILTFQIAPFENDASPSRPILYEIEQI
ncbi:MAG: metal-dependent hydrolase [Crocinitomicaceae bacterium]|nr:metal-dependent hydrolase [Crocinitomicaceae bacterium]|tara:strand:+ start:69828 stop:70580 length:753 start_codon:yes stop_codon:yes gene_type:complete